MTDYERIEKIILYLEANYLQQPSLKELAKIAGLSEFHFQRVFSRWVGVTPKTFLQYLTASHAKKLLLESKDVLAASLESGLSGSSRLHDLMISVEAMTPGEFKAEGKGLEIQYGVHHSPFGPCLIGLTKRGICHLAFIDSDKEKFVREMKERWPGALFKKSQSGTAKIAETLFKKSGKKKISVLLRGTPFQLKVWEALLHVPEGTLVSYEHLAKMAGLKGARAVGSAVARNSIAYLIPCHRIIRETGVLGQYRWGASRKRAILSWEQVRKA